MDVLAGMGYYFRMTLPRLNGWARLGVLLSALWCLSVGVAVTFEYLSLRDAVSSSEVKTGRFVRLLRTSPTPLSLEARFGLRDRESVFIAGRMVQIVPGRELLQDMPLSSDPNAAELRRRYPQASVALPEDSSFVAELIKWKKRAHPPDAELFSPYLPQPSRLVFLKRNIVAVALLPVVIGWLGTICLVVSFRWVVCGFREGN